MSIVREIRRSGCKDKKGIHVVHSDQFPIVLLIVSN